MIFRKPIIQNNLFEGIMGREEFLVYQESLSLKDRENLALISISEPDNDEYHNPVCTIGFHDVLEVKFWDVDENIPGYPPLTFEQGQIIQDFIIKNKDKKFLVHCKAGISRSAGVGTAIECIVNYGGDIYNYRTGKSEISEYPRYYPNKCVFDRVLTGTKCTKN